MGNNDSSDNNYDRDDRNGAKKYMSKNTCLKIAINTINYITNKN